MSIGQQGAKLNYDSEKAKTPAFYDAANDMWLIGSGQFIKDDSGIWRPVSRLVPVPSERVARKPELIATGTVSVVSGNQYPTSNEIAEPSTVYERFLLAFYNVTDVTLQSVTTFSPNVTLGSPVTVLSIGAIDASFGDAGNAGTVYFHPNNAPYLFALGPSIYFQFNLNPAPASDGTIHWALYGQP